jgi:hypothetical protein
MAVRAREWLRKHPHGTYPRHTARAKVTDKWLSQDHPSPSPAATSAKR